MKGNILDCAIQYAKRGWHVFPVHSVKHGRCTCGNEKCPSPGKHPMTPNGLKDATTNIKIINEWKWQYANIGIRTGEISNLVVIDIDIGEGKFGEESIHQLEQKYGPLPNTIESITGSGGRHIYYKHPGFPIGNKVGIFSGVDIRADEACVIAPPSKHISGNCYEWEASSHPDDMELANMPNWLFKILREESNINRNNSFYLEENIPDHQRNSTLASFAGGLRWYGFEKAEISAALQVANKSRCEIDKDGEVLSESEVENIAASVSKYPSGGNCRVNYELKKSPKAPPCPQLAQELMSQYHFISTAGNLYIYKDGLYQKGGDRHIKRNLQDWLGNSYKSGIADEVIKYVEVETYQDSEFLIAPTELINVKNGLIHWATNELRPHNPQIISFTQLPVFYDPDATCPTIDRYFDTTLPADCIDLVEEIFGYCMIPDTRFQKAFMLTGEGQTGKGTFINLIDAFLGPKNVSKIPLQELDENRFKRAGIMGKLVNVFADLDKRSLKGTAYFKTITSGDVIDAEHKYRDPFNFRPYAKLIFSANELPHTPDQTYAYFRRWVLVQFSNRFDHTRADLDILSKMTADYELSGLMNRSLVGLNRLFQQERFSESDSTHQAKEAYRKSSDNVYLFLDEQTEQGSQFQVGRTEFYDRYKNWCHECGLMPFSQRNFNERVEKPDNVNRGSTGEMRIWKGIRLINQKKG